MKKIIFILAFLLAGISAEAQKFLRYQMNDGTYNGFYTEGIESITHDYKDGVATAFVQASGKIHEIPVDAIENISVENADIDDGNVGEYRIYEFNYDEGDVKKIYVDNRTFLFASHNGDFGANDTILFSSAYNDMACLFYTDGQGRVRKIFDGKKLLYFDYDDDGSGFSMLDLETGNSYHYCFDSTLNSASRIRGIQALKGLNFFSNLLKTERGNFWGDAGLAAIGIGASEFADRMDAVGDNPELRGMFLFTDALSIAGDMLGIGLSLLGEVPTGGWSTAGLVLSAGMLMYDLNELMWHLFPDSEQMKKYEEFYRNKYAITVKTIAPENVTCNKADLRGTFMSFNGVKGELYFNCHQLTDSGLGDRIVGSTEAVTSNSYIVKGSATNLKPGINYFYMLWYKCEVNGLLLTFPADNAMDFTTPLPSATTIGKESVEERSAVVKCSFSNIPEGAICGVQYGRDGSYNVAIASSSDGETTVNLTGLKPGTDYSYRAFIQYEGENYYGETLVLTTAFPDISGTWSCTEEYYPHSWSTTPSYETYSLTLYKDGSASCSKYENIESGTWGFQGDGTVVVSIITIATQTVTSGVEWSGKIEDMENPTRIKGGTHNWNYNQIGAFTGDTRSFLMTK